MKHRDITCRTIDMVIYTCLYQKHNGIVITEENPLLLKGALALFKLTILF